VPDRSDLNTRKNQNSILVLATLGVYLGLVLVGATPQVVAQAAMTRQFNVKDEIEFAEDLDKKPPDTVLESDNHAASPSDRFVAASIDKFFSGLALTHSVSSRAHLIEPRSRPATADKFTSSQKVSRSHLLGTVLTTSNFARAGLRFAA
jgi:hypothetical protein